MPEVYGTLSRVNNSAGQQVGWARFGRTGRYLGSTGMTRGSAGGLRNAIRTVSARQNARTARAYRAVRNARG